MEEKEEGEGEEEEVGHCLWFLLVVFATARLSTALSASTALWSSWSSSSSSVAGRLERNWKWRFSYLISRQLPSISTWQPLQRAQERPHTFHTNRASSSALGTQAHSFTKRANLARKWDVSQQAGRQAGNQASNHATIHTWEDENEEVRAKDGKRDQEKEGLSKNAGSPKIQRETRQPTWL